MRGCGFRGVACFCKRVPLFFLVCRVSGCNDLRGGGGGLASCPCWSDVLREVVRLGGYCMPLHYLLGDRLRCGGKSCRLAGLLGLLSYYP